MFNISTRRNTKNVRNQAIAAAADTLRLNIEDSRLGLPPVEWQYYSLQDATADLAVACLSGSVHPTGPDGSYGLDEALISPPRSPQELAALKRNFWRTMRH